MRDLHRPDPRIDALDAVWLIDFATSIEWEPPDFRRDFGWNCLVFFLVLFSRKLWYGTTTTTATATPITTTTTTTATATATATATTTTTTTTTTTSTATATATTTTTTRTTTTTTTTTHTLYFIDNFISFSSLRWYRLRYRYCSAVSILAAPMKVGYPLLFSGRNTKEFLWF